MIRRAITAVLFATMLLVPNQITLASQGNLVMPTSGIFSGVQISSLITAGLTAVASCNAGNNEPANGPSGLPVLGQCWDDTSENPTHRKLFDGDQWITVAHIDDSNHILIPPVGGGTKTITAATTVDLCSSPETHFQINGTTQVNFFGSGSGCAAGQIKLVKFASAGTLRNSSSLVLPSGANIPTEVGDYAIAVYLGSSVWVVPVYSRASGEALVGSSGGGDPETATSVPVGAMLDFAGMTPPTNFEFCAGQGLNRAGNPDLYTALTSTQSVTRSGTTLSGFSSTDGFRTGMNIEGVGIQTDTTIVSKTASAVVMSRPATSGVTANVTVFMYGNGNGSTTFNIPDSRGRVRPGRDDMVSAASRLTAATPAACAGNGLGAACGNQEGTLVENQLPAVSKNVSVSGTVHVAGTTGGAGSHEHQMFAVKGGVPNTSELTGATQTVAMYGNAGDSDDFKYIMASQNAEATRGATSTVGTHTHTFSDDAPFSGSDTVSFGSGNPHSRLQPSLVVNCIIRVK